MERLPVEDALPDLLAALAAGPSAVLAAPPGAGKTTRVPLALLGAPWLAGRILMLEPRRIAARAAAERLAAGLGERVGGRVGYRIRGESRPGSRIEVVTEGILTRMLQSDAVLPGIGAILFDEVHERSIHTDLGLALALEAREVLRPDLRLLAMSATLDVAGFARLLGAAPVIESAGRAHEVTTRWLDRTWRQPGKGRRGFVEAAAALIRQALAETDTGDLLAFLPGAGEIGRVATLLRDGAPDLAIAELHGSLPFARQRAVLARDTGPRRVVLATSIAETSLTVPGVHVVVDTGLARRSLTDAGTGLARLVTTKVSRAAADQRRGRAGRLGPGVCYRMWSKGEEGALPAFAPPEILATDLAPLALELALWGAEPAGLRWLDPPPEAALMAARSLLSDLGALDADDRITDHGREMAAAPTHPRLAHMLLRAHRDGQAGEAALLAALLQERDPLRGRGADLRERLAVAAGRRDPAADAGAIARIRTEATRLAHPAGARGKPPGLPQPHRAATLAGPLAAEAYPDRIALRRPGDAPRYLLSNGRGAVLDAADPLAGERLLVAVNLEDGTEARIRLAVPITEGELREVAGPRLTPTETVEWSPRTARVEARRREMLGAIALSDETWRNPPPERLAGALLDGIRAQGVAALNWPEAALSLRARIGWLRRQGGALAAHLPDWSDAGLAATLEEWLAPWLARERRIEDIGVDLTAALSAMLDHDLRRLIEHHAPARITTPLGSAAIDYARDQPAISVRVQEMFGVTAHPMVGDPPVPLRIELLSPARRPVQVTADLPGFWAASYADVRRDMRARYPRHPWPEDPVAAAPTRRAKQRGK